MSLEPPIRDGRTLSESLVRHFQNPWTFWDPWSRLIGIGGQVPSEYTWVRKHDSGDMARAQIASGCWEAEVALTCPRPN